MENHIKYNIYRDVFSDMVYALLLGAEFPNTYGQGKTPEQAVQGLKIRVNQLKRRK